MSRWLIRLKHLLREPKLNLEKKLINELTKRTTINKRKKKYLKSWNPELMFNGAESKVKKRKTKKWNETRNETKNETK